MTARIERCWWRGTASGGPLDGSEISIETAPFIPMRGLQVNVCLGDTPATSTWHVYRLTQRFDEHDRLTGTFVHLGALDGPPAMPSANE